jgi:hypothetical protein
LDYAEAITITYNDKETDKLTIDRAFFHLENDMPSTSKPKAAKF